MSKSRSRKFTVHLAFLLILVMGGSLLSPISTRASAILPQMSVTLTSGDLGYASTVYAEKPLTLVAQIKNTGNVPLQVTAYAPTPLNWDVDKDKTSDCPESLGLLKTCTMTWYFTPQASGQVYLRVYARGYYTGADDATHRVTQSPAFIFNVHPPKGSSTSSGGSSGSSGGSTTSPTSSLPNMAVTLISGGSTYASTVYAGKPLVFQAQVKNIGGLPLKITASLATPTGWDLEADPSNDCPDSLEVRKTCTFTWNFTPQAAGQVYLRVYVRGVYTLSSGATDRIVASPAFIFNVHPPKVTE